MENSNLSLESDEFFISSMAANAPRFDLQVGDVIHVSATLDEMRAKGVPEAALLGHIKGLLKAAVDVRAEAIRSRIATAGAGQAMEYQEAARQAEAALAAPDLATAERHPMLGASVGIDVDPETGLPAVDVLGVARSVKAAYDLWQMAGAAIRNVRLAGKKAIDDAATDEAAAAAYSAIVWPVF